MGTKPHPGGGLTASELPSKPVEPIHRHKVFIVDDHPIAVAGLTSVINNEPDFVVVGHGGDAYGSLRTIRQSPPDLVLVDISLKGSDGIDLLKELKCQMPNLPALVVSTHDEAAYGERALRAGARGYITKQEPSHKLLGAMRAVLAGEVYVSPHFGESLLRRLVEGKKADETHPIDRLTDRQLQIFREMGAGKTVAEIAEKLCLSTKTVEAHREHIKGKLNIKSSIELMRFAILNSSNLQ
jgi:DNA-binding NarL/FixJ family response regulator